MATKTPIISRRRFLRLTAPKNISVTVAQYMQWWLTGLMMEPEIELTPEILARLNVLFPTITNKDWTQ